MSVCKSLGGLLVALPVCSFACEGREPDIPQAMTRLQYVSSVSLFYWLKSLLWSRHSSEHQQGRRSMDFLFVINEGREEEGTENVERRGGRRKDGDSGLGLSSDLRKKFTTYSDSRGSINTVR